MLVIVKRILFVAVAGLIVSSFSASSALAASNLTTVRGNVYNQGFGGTVPNNELKGLTVIVSCVTKETPNKLKTVTKTAVTDSLGLYTVNIKEKKCEANHDVSSTVTFKGETQTHSVKVSGQLTATIDFHFNKPSEPPETGYGGGKEKETICKKTGSDIMPYVKITVPQAEADKFIHQHDAVPLDENGKCPNGNLSLRDFISKLLKDIFGKNS